MSFKADVHCQSSTTYMWKAKPPAGTERGIFQKEILETFYLSNNTATAKQKIENKLATAAHTILKLSERLFCSIYLLKLYENVE